MRSLLMEQLEARHLLTNDLNIFVNDASDSFEGFDSPSDRNIFVPTVSLNSQSISLREAIHLANNAGDQNVIINLQPDVVYRLGRARGWTVPSQDIFFDDLDIRRGMTINGNGATVIAGGFGAFDAFTSSSTTQQLVMKDLTLKDATRYGLTVVGRYDLSLRNVSFISVENVAANAPNDTVGADARGAALIINPHNANITSNVSIVGGSFEQNRAIGGKGGDADNGNDGKDAGDAYGSAIYANRTNLTINDTRFSDNQSNGGVGGAADDSNATGGRGGDSFGGAIYATNGSRILVNNANFDGNQAGVGFSTGGESRHSGGQAGQGGSSFGGAIFVGAQSSLAVSSSLFNENVANASTGGFGNSNNFYGVGGIAKGGAIYADFGATALDLKSATQFTTNVAIGGAGGKALFTGGRGNAGEGGGVWTAAGGTWENLLFQDNAALGGDGAGNSDGQGGAGGDANGGAAQITNASLVTIEGTVFEANNAKAGSGGGAAPNQARPGGHGGNAKAGALRVFGASVLSIQGNTQFVLNGAAGGDGGNAGDFNLGTQGNGGNSFGGALEISNGARVVLSANPDSPIDFVNNTAGGGNAGQPVQGRDNLAKPGVGGNAAGGAVSTSSTPGSNAGFFATGTNFASNTSAAGMGSSGVTVRKFTGTFRLSRDNPRQDAANPTLYRFGGQSGDSGRAIGGAIYSSGNLQLNQARIIGNTASGFRGEINDEVYTPDAGTDANGTSFRGSSGGDAWGGAIYATNGNPTISDSLIMGNRAIAGRGGNAGATLGIQQDVQRNATPERPGLISLWNGNVRGGAGGDGGDASGGAVFADLLSTQTIVFQNSDINKNIAMAGKGGGGADGNIDLNGDYGDDQGNGGQGGQGGSAFGGGIYVPTGTLRLLSTSVIQNSAIGGDGGQGGKPSLREMHNGSGQVPPNLVGGSGGTGGNTGGGGIAALNAVIDASTIADNNVSSGWGGFGGSAEDDPRSNVAGNPWTPTGQVGLVVYLGTKPIQSFGASGGRGGDGGSAAGGGINLLSGRTTAPASLTVTNSTITGNRVLSGQGGFGGDGGEGDWSGGDSGSGGNSQSAQGGGIYAGFSSSVIVTGSTIVSNGIATGGAGVSGLSALYRYDAQSGAVPRPKWQLQQTVPFGALAAAVDQNIELNLGLVRDANQVRPSILYPLRQTPMTPDQVAQATTLRNVRDAIRAGITVGQVGELAASTLLRYATEMVSTGDTVGLDDVGHGKQVARLSKMLKTASQKASSRIVRSAASIGTKIATKTVMSALRVVSKIPGPWQIGLTVAVEVGGMIVTSFIYGKGDFVKGLKMYARENSLPPDFTDGPFLGSLFYYAGEEEAPPQPPNQTHGRSGVTGQTRQPLGSNISIFGTGSSFDGRLLISRSIVAEGVTAVGGHDRYTNFLLYNDRLISNVDLVGPTTSGGYNFVGSTSSMTPTQGDQINTNERLLIQRDLSRASTSVTPTLKLNAGSPARYAGPTLTTAEVSQNGFARAVGTKVSIGAWDGSRGQDEAPIAADFVYPSSLFSGQKSVNIPVTDLINAAKSPNAVNVRFHQITKIVTDDGRGGINTQSFDLIPTYLTSDERSVRERGTSVIQRHLDQDRKVSYTSTSKFKIYYTLSDGELISNEGVIYVGAEDTLAPTSRIVELPQNASSKTFVVSVDGRDLSNPNSIDLVSGAKEYDVYVASDQAPFKLWKTIPAASPSATFTGESGRTYFFKSIARDIAGNQEADHGVDTFIRLGDLDAPDTRVVAAVADNNGSFNIRMSGTDSGGSQLSQFDLYVAVDLNLTFTLVASVGAGLPNSQGVYTAVVPYQGLVDGKSHTYQFYTVGKDAAGNTESTSNIANRVVRVTYTFVNQSLLATGIDVQLGARQRSFVRYVDVLFNNPNTQALLAPGRIRVERFAINATNVDPGTGTHVDASIASVGSSGRLRLDFGVNGLGGSRVSSSGDGFYRVRLDLNGDNDFADAGESFEFHRLVADVNGDGIVDQSDTAAIDACFGQQGLNLEADLNGDGVVNMADRVLTQRTFRGRRLDLALLAMLDD